MNRNRTIKFLWIMVLLAVALMSCFILSRIFTSTDFCAPLVQILDEKRVEAFKLSASAAAISTAITLLPGDICTPLADQLTIISVFVIVIVSTLVFEKYLITVSAYLTFVVFIPLACLCGIMAIVSTKNMWKEKGINIAVKLAAFGLALFLLVPLSLKITSLIDQTHECSIELTNQEAEKLIAEINNDVSDESIWDKITAGLKAKASEWSIRANNSFHSIIDSLAVLIVTACFIPILTLVVLIIIIKSFFNMRLGIRVKSAVNNNEIPGVLDEPRKDEEHVEVISKPINADSDIEDVREVFKKAIQDKIEKSLHK